MLNSLICKDRMQFKLKLLSAAAILTTTSLEVLLILTIIWQLTPALSKLKWLMILVISLIARMQELVRSLIISARRKSLISRVRTRAYVLLLLNRHKTTILLMPCLQKHLYQPGSYLIPRLHTILADVVTLITVADAVNQQGRDASLSPKF